MPTTTAFIMVGKADQNHSGIIPNYYIQFTENDRPALILRSIEGEKEKKVIIPTIENTIDDIYLMIVIYVLKKITLPRELYNLKRISLYELLDDKERFEMYKEAQKILKDIKIKVVFNILDESHLLDLVSQIKNYPHDFEVTLPALKKEYNSWTKDIIKKGL